jgi:hypothetical protein
MSLSDGIRSRAAAGSRARNTTGDAAATRPIKECLSFSRVLDLVSAAEHAISPLATCQTILNLSSMRVAEFNFRL